MIAKVHTTPIKTVESAFRRVRSKKRIAENTHYFHLDFTEASSLLQNEEANSQGLIVLNKLGYLMLVKALDDDRAWDIYAHMVHVYFTFAQPTMPVLLDTPKKFEPKFKGPIAAHWNALNACTRAGKLKTPDDESSPCLATFPRGCVKTRPLLQGIGTQLASGSQPGHVPGATVRLVSEWSGGARVA